MLAMGSKGCTGLRAGAGWARIHARSRPTSGLKIRRAFPSFVQDGVARLRQELTWFYEQFNTKQVHFSSGPARADDRGRRSRGALP